MPAVATIIISTYKKTRELELILYALAFQTVNKFEIIVSDDGSGGEMERFVSHISKKFSFNIKFITQEDTGFRKNKILNEAVRNSLTDYLIFLDGDCLPRNDFVEAHLKYKKDNTVLCGRRVNLNFELAKNISTKKIVSNKYQQNTFKILSNSFGFGEKTKYAEEALIIKNRLLRKFFGANSIGLLGCNFSIPKGLLYKINGFDENYVGPGFGEDTDIEFRLKLINAEFKSVRNLAVVYHLWHKETKINEKNEEYFEKVKTSNNYFCLNGLNKSIKKMSPEGNPET